MKIKKITLENFRNYIKEEIKPIDGRNIIFGKNGQGKTNLVEAIYLLSSGKSFRTNNLKDMIYFDKDFFRVKINFEDDLAIDSEIFFYFDINGKKNIKINETKVEKYSDLMENLYVVVFSPEDLKFIKEEPEKRRKFIDREICQINKRYFSNLISYNKVLKQRNFYIKNGNINFDYLDVLDDQLVEYGSKIISEREEYIKKINKISEEIHHKITDNKENIKINYKKSVTISNYKEKLFDNRYHDIESLRTNYGPHKDDLIIEINGINARKYGSQGQQRTAALSIKLSQIDLIKKEKKENPILILDDVFSELDNSRKGFLLEYLDSVQSFLTTAEKIKFIDGKNINVLAGKII